MTESLDTLYRDARAALDDAEIDVADALAERLLDAGDRRGVEIRARARSLEFDTPGAIETIEAALERWPDDWALWQLLGGYHEDLGDLDAADEAYVRSQACPGAWQASLAFDRADIASRTGDHEQVLALLEPIEDFGDPELRDRAVVYILTARRAIRALEIAHGSRFRFELAFQLPDGEVVVQRVDVAAEHESQALELMTADLGPPYEAEFVTRKEVVGGVSACFAGVMDVKG